MWRFSEYLECKIVDVDQMVYDYVVVRGEEGSFLSLND